MPLPSTRLLFVTRVCRTAEMVLDARDALTSHDLQAPLQDALVLVGEQHDGQIA